MSTLDLKSTTMKWTPSIDENLASKCDEAKCFEWMHTESYDYYNTRAQSMAIITNIFTAVSGVSNIIGGGIIIGAIQLSWVFGSISIIVSILNMIQEKLAYSSLATRHKNYATQWGVIHRKIQDELFIPIDFRKDCSTFIKNLEQDINKVSMDGNASIPEKIRDECFEKFNTIPQFNVPDICGQIEHTKINPNSWKESTDTLDTVLIQDSVQS